MLICNFANETKRTEFLAGAGLSSAPTADIEIPLSLVSIARAFDGVVTKTGTTSDRYIIKIDDISTLTTEVTVVTSEGTNGLLTVGSSNFWVVETTLVLELYDELNGNVEQVNTPIKLLSTLAGTTTTTLPENYDWSRLRFISRHRPFASEWKLAECNFTRKPNLVVLDSGINFNHREFEGLETEDFFTLEKFNGSYQDDAGHGTIVASFACGKNVGLHRHLKLLNCKIFSATEKPTTIEIGQALDACYARYMEDTSVPMVLNMSWNGSKSAYIESKISTLISAGIVVVCAAGNSNLDVDLLTPAGMVDVVTVAASDLDDVSAGFNNFSEYDYPVTSNYGLKVDIFAPGVDCVGAHYSSTDTYATASGTSLSAGYVSGCMAAILALVPGTYRQSAMKILMDNATKGVLLLDMDNYHFNQNNLAHLITAEIPTTDITSYYLGNFSTSTTTIIGNANQIMNVSRYSGDTGEDFTYQAIWSNETPVDTNCMVFDHTDGSFTITNPSLEWQEGERIRLLEFKFSAISTSSSITFYSPDLVFFAFNPTVTDSVDEDVLAILDSKDSQNFFSPWSLQAKQLP